MIKYAISDDFDESYYVVGDIHASLFRLKSTYEDYIRCRKRGYNNMKLIYLGDYLDRGIDGTEVINLILDIQTNSRYKDDIYFLLGNHEVYRYDHTLTINDPTLMYDSRLDYFKEKGLVFYIAYYNSFRNLLFTHSGMSDTRNIEEKLQYYCDKFNNKDGKLEVNLIDKQINLCLNPENVKLHDSFFYGLVPSFDINIETHIIKKELFHSHVTQVLGHYHKIFYVSGDTLYPITALDNISKDNVDWILLDASDNKCCRNTVIIRGI